jgi:hypothetical protein
MHAQSLWLLSTHTCAHALTTETQGRAAQGMRRPGPHSDHRVTCHPSLLAGEALLLSGMIRTLPGGGPNMGGGGMAACLGTARSSLPRLGFSTHRHAAAHGPGCRLLLDALTRATQPPGSRWHMDGYHQTCTLCMRVDESVPADAPAGHDFLVHTVLVSD